MNEVIMPYTSEVEGEVVVNERRLQFPATLNIIGVQNDNNVEEISFKILKIFDGTVDLSTFTFKVNWINALGIADSNTVETSVQEQFVIIKWKVPKELCVKDGKVKISISADNIDGRSWNTTYAEAEILKGIVVNEGIVAKYPDVIKDLQARVGKLEKGGGTANTKTIVDEVLKQLPKWNGGEY